MAVGVRYFGRGTSGLPAIQSVTPLTVTRPASTDPTDPLGDLGLYDTNGGGSAAAAMNAQTARGRLNLARQQYQTDLQTTLAKLQQSQAELALKVQQDAADRAAAAATLARTQAGARQQADYLRGLLGEGVAPELSQMVDTGEREGYDFIQQQAANLLAQLNQRRAQAQQLTTQGYDALQRYLEANAPRAYATAQGAMPVVTQNALAQYMQAQGVSPQTVAGDVAAINALAQGGAANYNQLLNVLRGVEAAGQQSRLAEQAMARNVSQLGLEGIYGAATSGLEQQRLAALADLAANFRNTRLALAQQAIARRQAIQDALAALAGTGYLNTSGTDTSGTDTSGTETSGTGTEGAVTGLTPDEALARLAQLAPTDPNAPSDMMLRNVPSPEEVAALIALAQQSNAYTGGGGGGGVAPGNVAVMF